MGFAYASDMTSPSLDAQLARLAAFEPSPYPVISLYLNTQPDERGRDNFQTFVRKELKARAQTYPQRSSERGMLERDARAERAVDADDDPAGLGRLLPRDARGVSHRS